MSVSNATLPQDKPTPKAHPTMFRRLLGNCPRKRVTINKGKVPDEELPNSYMLCGHLSGGTPTFFIIFAFKNRLA